MSVLFIYFYILFILLFIYFNILFIYLYILFIYFYIFRVCRRRVRRASEAWEACRARPILLRVPWIHRQIRHRRVTSARTVTIWTTTITCLCHACRPVPWTRSRLCIASPRFGECQGWLMSNIAYRLPFRNDERLNTTTLTYFIHETKLMIKTQRGFFYKSDWYWCQIIVEKINILRRKVGIQERKWINFHSSLFLIFFITPYVYAARINFRFAVLPGVQLVTTSWIREWAKRFMRRSRV